MVDRCEATRSMGISESSEGCRPSFFASLRASRALARTVVDSTAVATSFVVSCGKKCGDTMKREDQCKVEHDGIQISCERER